MTSRQGQACRPQVTPRSMGRASRRVGVIVSAANPYWIIWWLTIGVMYAAGALKYGWLGLSCFYSGHILADYVWYVLIAVIAATGKKFITAAIYKWILAGCGVLMMFLALYFSLQGIKAII